MKKNKGFTLIELLVVITIMGILTVISIASFTNAQVKTRDSQRKSDLNALSKALMMYYNDTGSFPTESMVQFGNEAVGLTGSNAIVYMRKTPKDPKNTGDYTYVYKVDSTFKMFNLYANLESKTDASCNTTPYLVGGKNYCYGLSSPNTIVDPSQF